jgi:hypothetical protein
MRFLPLLTALSPVGACTKALMNETVYVTKLLCDPIPFTVVTDVTDNAMQSDCSEGVAA